MAVPPLDIFYTRLCRARIVPKSAKMHTFRSPAGVRGTAGALGSAAAKEPLAAAEEHLDALGDRGNRGP